MPLSSDVKPSLFCDAAPLEPGFLVVHANLPEQLRALIVHWTKAYPLAVLETETVLVQSNGIAQWLKLALAADSQDANGQDANSQAADETIHETADVATDEAGLGIASCLSLQMPGRFIWQLYRAVLSEEQIPEQSAFDKAQLRWRLFKLLPQLCRKPDFAVLAHYLADDQSQRKLDQLALKLADLFDQYQVYRADWLQAWGEGKDVLINARGEQSPLAPEQCWQAALWRAVLADVPEEERVFSRAGLHQQFLAAARAFSSNNRPAGLPRRVIVFGISSLPQQMLEALAAIAPYTQVLLAVHNPCQHYWADIIADKELLRAQVHRQKPKQQAVLADVNAQNPLQAEQDSSAVAQHAQPLLAAWGKQGRDYIALLDQFDQTMAHRFLFAGERVDLFSPAPSDTLLGQLQNDILELRPLTETKTQWPALPLKAAQSISFATAHSALREVEILHDDLLAQFARDPMLKPADIMVMVPDIDQYAAAISAVFGRFNRDDNRYIPFTIADQSAVSQEPLLQALKQLLALPGQRFTVSFLLDLLQLPALAQRFSLQPADLPLLQRWIEVANIRWGLHAGQRQSLGLPQGLWQNSWQYGLQRMLLGFAVGDGDVWQDIAPCGEVAGLSAVLAGQLATLLAQLEQYWQQSQQPKTPAAWTLWLQQLLADFFVATDEHEAELIQQLHQALGQWLAQCRQSELDTELHLPVVAQSWLDGFSSQGLAQRFLAGAVNFATLMPMRAIPFAQIHLLGMNDGDFPRQMLRQDFDLMSHSYRPGDRSRRDDDRYLLLEALLSARKRLRISWIGHSVHDNSERAPSVLIGQLRDHLAAGWSLAPNEGQPDLLTAITVHHPLQAFSRRYLGSATLPSFQHEWLALHQKPATDIAAQQQNLLLLPDELPLWDFSRLAGWLKDPVKFFFRQRLKVLLEENHNSLPGSEDFSLDPLQRWQLQQRLQQHLLAAIDAGQNWQQALAEELQRVAQEGLLPLGGAAVLLQQQFSQLLAPQAEAYQALLASEHTTLLSPLWLEFAHGAQRCGDWLRGVRQIGATAAADQVDKNAALVQYQWLVGALYKNKQLQYAQLLGPWLQQLFSSANGYKLQVRLLAVDADLSLPPLEPQQAQQLLAALYHWLSESLNRPIPVELHSACLWLQAELSVDAPLPDKVAVQLQKLYEGDGFSSGRVERNRYLARAYPDFAALWQQGEMARVATALYQPLRQYLLKNGIMERG